ncbi:MAG: type 1 glutamine amidotransferase domain-containing protein [Lentisphaeria bacterium]|nr:type 1 glutamine amidotransferase domain-containing protein [Lentisphaeria bacterium]
MKRVLIAVTSHDRMGYTAEQTGLNLEEFACAYHRFTECSFSVTVASPEGGEVPIDPRSVTLRALGVDSKRFLAGEDTILDNTEKLADIDPDDFCALFYPGGHGSMWDLATDHRNARIASSFFERDKPVGAVCHGCAALLKARKYDGYPVIYGRKLTAISNTEEAETGFDGIVPFMLEDRLKELGAIFSSGNTWHPHIVRDGNLITGQNPRSAGGVADSIIREIRRNNGRIPLCRAVAWRYVINFF